MIFIFFALCIPVFYWALVQPERAFVGGWRQRILWAIALFLSALATISLFDQVGTSVLFVAYPLLYGVLLRRPLRALFSRWLASRVGQFVVVFLLLWFSELFAALEIADIDPVGRHMIVYIGFYVGLAGVIVFAVPRWRYGFAALYTIGGLWGVLIEQQFLIPRTLLSGDLVGALTMASMVFSVYGLYVAGPYLLLHEEWQRERPAPRWRHILLFILLAVVPLVAWGISTLILGALGFDTTVLIT
jgi:hypothetical protein